MIFHMARHREFYKHQIINRLYCLSIKEGNDKETSELLYSTLFCHFKEPLYLLQNKGISWEKRIFSLKFFVKPSSPLGWLFVFCVFYSFDEMQSSKTAFFCFRPASLPVHPPLMPVYYIGIGCSLSAAKIVLGFYGQKRSGQQAV